MLCSAIAPIPRSCWTRRASDQWAYFTRRRPFGVRLRRRSWLARLTPDTPSQASQSTAKTFRDNSARYEQESKAIEDHAREYERDRDRYRRQADRFDFAEIFLEVSIVMCSLAILTKRRSIWLASGAIAIGGVLVALTVLGLR